MSNNTQQTAITKVQQPTDVTVRDMLARNLKSIEAVLPKHLTPARLSRIIVNCIAQSPDLQKCSVTSLYKAALAAAETGLEPGGVRGEAYLVPYKTEAQFIIGYRGLRKLALQSGYIASIYAEAVHANDEFEFTTGLQIKLHHKPALEGEPGPLRLVYAVAKFKDPTVDPVVVVMTKAQVDAVRARSRATSEKSPWNTDYEEMAKKTAIRRIAKSVPLSADDASDRFEKAIDIDNKDFDVSTSVLASTTAPPPQAQLASNTTVEVPTPERQFTETDAAHEEAAPRDPAPAIEAAQQLVDVAQQAQQPKPTPPPPAPSGMAFEEGKQWLEEARSLPELSAAWSKLQARKGEGALTPDERKALMTVYKTCADALKGAKP